MKSLRLPSNWNCLTLHQKLNYLVNTRQAENYAKAGVLLNRQKEINKEKVKKIKLDHIKEARLPYSDPDLLEYAEPPEYRDN